MVRGLSEAGLASILQARERDGPFTSVDDFRRRTHVPRPVVENLIRVRAFDFGKRGQSPVSYACTPAGQTHRGEIGDCPYFPVLTEVERVAADLHVLGVSTTKNPFSFWRPRMEEMGVTPSSGLYDHEDGDRVKVAGIVVARARPPTRSGKTAIFISLEDEFGLVDIAVFEEAYQRCGRALYSSPVLCVEGKLTRKGKLDLSVTAEEVIGMGGWQDFELSVPDLSLGSAVNKRLTPAKGGERRQAAGY